MEKLIIDAEKLLLFTDIHYGKSKDSSLKLKTADEFIDNLIKTAKKNKIKDVLFLGDWFDNRNSISVKTYFHSYESVKKITDADLKLYMIVGNHDAYFKDSIDVNSVAPLGDVNGVTVIDKLTEVHFVKQNKYSLFCPWNSLPNDIKFDKNSYDSLFGHFEFEGAQLFGSHLSKGNYSGKQLTDLAPLVFSGHFHIRKIYEYKSGNLITLGCPFELDWGDYDNKKGMYLLDLGTMDYDFIENKFSPKHKKIFWSNIDKKGFNISENEKLIKGNYIKLIVDKEYKFEEVMRVANLINTKSPLKQCETEFIYNTKFNFLNEFQENYDDTEVVNMSKIDYLLKFIEKTPKEDLQNLSIKKLENLAKKYYNKANDNLEDGKERGED
jgi:DNA repair exonuclease SbcCD nuclease subunit